MFVRGGVYRAVKMSLGGTLAKFSVSALMFDYILTGPISGVAAGQYLAGLINDLLQYFHVSGPLSSGTTSFIAAGFAIVVTLYFLVAETPRALPSQRKSSAHHEAGHRDGSSAHRLVRLHSGGASFRAASVAAPAQPQADQQRPRLARAQQPSSHVWKSSPSLSLSATPSWR